MYTCAISGCLKKLAKGYRSHITLKSSNTEVFGCRSTLCDDDNLIKFCEVCILPITSRFTSFFKLFMTKSLESKRISEVSQVLFCGPCETMHERV